MLSYPIDEAETLLTSKLSLAKQSYLNCEEDLDFLREQITASFDPNLLLLFCTSLPSPPPFLLPLPTCVWRGGLSFLYVFTACSAVYVPPCDHDGHERTTQLRMPRLTWISRSPSLGRVKTMEVAIARVYNWDVVQKRKEKAEEESKGKGEKESGSDQPNG